MGISVSVLYVSDEQIQGFNDKRQDASELFIGCTGFSEPECCHLHDHWDGINYLLTGDSDSTKLPLCAIKWGNMLYPTGVGDKIHALYPPTTRALAEALAPISQSRFKERFDLEAMSKAGPGGRPLHPGRPWLFPELADDSFRDLWTYFDSFRNFVAAAAENDNGLLFCRYEDY